MTEKNLTEEQHRLNDELYKAIEGNDDLTVRQLLDAGADVNAHGSTGRPLNWAAFLGSPEAMRILLEYGADVDARGLRQETSLHSVVRKSSSSSAKQHEECANLLLAAGARE